MDSMRSLNTSLPSSTTNAASTQPPEQLLQAFKTAALSVTNLYKTAASDQAHARHVGYQEALEDLRVFLDRERLGMEGGEVAKIRSWVVDRIDGTGATTLDSDDERGDNGKRTRSSSPTAVRKESPESNQPRQQTPRSQTPGPTPTTVSTSAPTNEPSTCSRPSTFTFTAGPQFPTSHHEDTDMPSSDHIRSSSPGSSPQRTTATSFSSPSVRVEVIPRGPRAQPHRVNNGARHGTRSSAREPSANAGSKRKFHFGDLFDISNLGNGRDGFGGGKRGRYT